jgi:uncharacterized SAM-binding protein YcdF (DUF218 family)
MGLVMKPNKNRSIRTRLLWLAIAGIVIATFYCLGFLLSASDLLPTHADAAIVLQGSIAGENARIAGAVPLLKAGVVNRIVLSIPRESYWGEAPELVARQYMEKEYGLSDQVEFCETGRDVNSTEAEAKSVADCLRKQGWHSVVVVTSSYHTRRAGLIWRRILRRQAPSVSIWVHGVEDPEWGPDRWWRTRIYAKTAFLESSKLLWTLLTIWF